jgi:hypothetical protein
LRVREAPPRRLSSSPLRSPTPTWRVWPPPLSAQRWAPPRPPWAPTLLPPLRPLVTEAGDSTSQQGPVPHRSPLLPPPPTTHSPESPGGRAPTARAAGTPHSLAPGAPAAGSSSPSCALPALVHTATRHGRPPGPGASEDPIMRSPRSPSTKRQLSRPHRCVARERGREGRPTHRRGIEEHNERPEVIVAVLHGFEDDGTPSPCGRILPGKAFVQ